MKENPKPSRANTPESSFQSAWHAMGDPMADTMVAKANLVFTLMKEIERRGLTQTAAAELLGIPRSNLSRLTSGSFRSVTFDKLFELLRKLGISVRVTLSEGTSEIVVEQSSRSKD